MKCARCGVDKEQSEFYPSVLRERRIASARCKACMKGYDKEWKKANPEKTLAIHARWRENNPDAVKAKCAKWRSQNAEYNRARVRKYQKENAEAIRLRRIIAYPERKEKQNAASRAWRLNNVAYDNYRSTLRKMDRRRAMPKWANKFFVEEAYELAALRSKVTGIAWHVDHVVPITSDLVCGLHCEQNLRVIPALQNISKRNFHWPDMP